ncbi:MAG TPA: succinate dehydrogenase, hydrophobic membrane anchor protein [Rhodopila sp.]
MAETPEVDILRTPLGRARGLGSAHAGFHHWWIERVEAVALIPLTIWFVVSLLHRVGAPHQAMIDWLSSPVSMVLMLLLIGTTFHHLSLGAQTVLDDYVHQPLIKLWSVLIVKGACAVLALLCIVCVLKIGL